NMFEIREHAALDHVAGLRDEIAECLWSVGLNQQARIDGWQVRIVRDHFGLACLFYSLSDGCCEDSARTTSAMRRICGDMSGNDSRIRPGSPEVSRSASSSWVRAAC